MKGSQGNTLTDFSNTSLLPFYFVVNSGTISANGTITQNLVMQADSDFELHWMGASSDDDADTDRMPNNFEVKITDQTTGRFITSARVPQRVIAIPANSGMYLPKPVRFPAQSIIEFEFLDLTGTTQIVKFVWFGYKIFN